MKKFIDRVPKFARSFGGIQMRCSEELKTFLAWIMAK